MEIKEYWSERAEKDKKNPTTNDFYLRVLERNTLVSQLLRHGCNENSSILDAGCGDGESLLEFHKKFGCTLTGRDFAGSMIDLAKARFADQPAARIDLAVGDVRNVGEFAVERKFDFITTDRCLINLDDEDQQYAAIAGIAKSLKESGVYFAIENFIEGQESLNHARSLYELPEIKIRWHNKFFSEEKFIKNVKSLFSSVEKIEFSSAYYFATRVIYSKMCVEQKIEPDYMHPIHKDSIKLPQFGSFSPIKLFVLRK